MRGEEADKDARQGQRRPERRTQARPRGPFRPERRTRRKYSNRPAALGRLGARDVRARVGGATAYPKAKGIWRDDERGGAAPGGHRRALPRAVRRRPADGSPLDRAAARPAGTTNARATRANRGQDPGAWGRERRADAARGTSTREDDRRSERGRGRKARASKTARAPMKLAESRGYGTVTGCLAAM